MKQKFIVEVDFTAMNEMSLYERLRDAIFTWQTTEPKIKNVSVVPAQEKAESRPTGRAKRPAQQRKVVITCKKTCNSPCDDRSKKRLCKHPAGDCSAQVKTTVA